MSAVGQPCATGDTAALTAACVRAEPLQACVALALCSLSPTRCLAPCPLPTAPVAVDAVQRHGAQEAARRGVLAGWPRGKDGLTLHSTYPPGQHCVTGSCSPGTRNSRGQWAPLLADQAQPGAEKPAVSFRVLHN